MIFSFAAQHMTEEEFEDSLTALASDHQNAVHTFLCATVECGPLWDLLDEWKTDPSRELYLDGDELVEHANDDDAKGYPILRESYDATTNSYPRKYVLTFADTMKVSRGDSFSLFLCEPWCSHLFVSLCAGPPSHGGKNPARSEPI